MKIYTKFILVLLVIGGLAYASYLYMTRPTKNPSNNGLINKNINTDSDKYGISNSYSIIEGSQVEYNIYEELNNEPITVVGINQQVYGNFTVDLSNTQSLNIGKISINARSFKTDNDRRDSAVVRYILHSEDDDKEFIEFIITDISNLPESLEIGQDYIMDISGDLTISGVTNPMTFTSSVRIETEDKIVINGEGQINYKDYNLFIPELPFLANVADQLTLKLNLISTKQ